MLKFFKSKWVNSRKFVLTIAGIVGVWISPLPLPVKIEVTEYLITFYLGVEGAIDIAKVIASIIAGKKGKK